MRLGGMETKNIISFPSVTPNAPGITSNKYYLFKTLLKSIAT